MRRIKIVVEYDGTKYCGWQIQPNAITIQEELEKAVEHLTCKFSRVNGASRTDSGVHARGQVAIFDTESDIPAERFAVAMNSRLPKNIAVKSSCEVRPDFSPRREAIRKQYQYRFVNSPIRPALDHRFVWHIKWKLDHQAMIEAAKRFVVTSDFTSFSNIECSRSGKNNERTIDRSELFIDGENLTYIIEARGFLYNMVRNIAGMLVDVGLGKFTPDDIQTILENRDRATAGQGAPALGLCLMWIQYPDNLTI